MSIGQALSRSISSSKSSQESPYPLPPTLWSTVFDRKILVSNNE